MVKSLRSRQEKFAILKTLPVAIRVEINRLMRLQLAENQLKLNKQILEKISHLRRAQKEVQQRRLENEKLTRIIKQLKTQSLAKNPRTGKLLPKDFDRRLAALSRRDERINRFETRVRSDILLIVREKNTPCKAIGSIRREGMASIEEALLALARSHEDAATNGDGTTRSNFTLQVGDTHKKITNEGGPDRPWDGHVTTVVNQGSNCAINIADMILMFARSPERIQSVVQTFRLRNHVKVAGTITVSYRIVYRKKTRLGVVKTQYESPQMFRTRVFIIGVPIKNRKE